MDTINTSSIDRDELFSQEEQEEMRKLLKLFEGMSRRRLSDDPKRVHEIRQIYCEAEKKEK